MGKYWNDKQDFKDYINADDFNEAFAQIETDVSKNTTDVANKVDKVDGKSLIDSGVADKLTADGDRIKVDGNVLVGEDSSFAEERKYVDVGKGNIELRNDYHNTTIDSDGIVADTGSGEGFSKVNAWDGVIVEAPFGSTRDVTLKIVDPVNPDNPEVHKLSQKANITDLDGKVDKNKEFKITDSSSESVYATYGSKKIQVYDGVDAFAETTITPTGIAGTGSDGSYSLKIGTNGGLHIEDVANNTDISISKSDGNGGKTIHKLSEKANKSEVLSANMDKDTVIKMGDYNVEPYAAQYSSDKIMFRNHNWAIGDTVYGSDELKIQENGTHKVVINNSDGINVTQVSDGADPADISLTVKDPATYEETTHKLSEKADKVDITALNNAITMAKFETRELDNSGWDGGSAPISVAIDLTTVTELYFYGGTGSVMLSSSGENYAIAKTRDEATNLIPLIKPQTAANNCDIYVMTAGLFYADIGTGVAINEYVKAIPQIYEDSGSLYVNVGDKKFKLTAAEV